jgi:hypothetical protein
VPERPPDPPDRESIRRDIRERLARGIYAMESARDRTDDRPRASWEELNQGRRATRLNYADELLSTLFGALALGWNEVDAVRACVRAAREGGGAGREAVEAAGVGLEPDQLAAAARAADVMAALLPRRVGREGG